MHASLAGGPVDRPESSALWKGPGRPGGRPDRESALCIQATVDRPVDRGSNCQKSDHWQSTGPIDRQPSGLLIWPQRLVFDGLFKEAIMGCFEQDFKKSFGLVLHTHFSGYIHMF